MTTRKSRWGVHETVALIKQDNRQRFIIAGSDEDPRASYYSQPVYPRGSGRRMVTTRSWSSTTATPLCVRRDLPVERVFETAAVLKHAYLFQTASKGVLCRESVPGSTIIYIRNIRLITYRIPE